MKRTVAFLLCLFAAGAARAEDSRYALSLTLSSGTGTVAFCVDDAVVGRGRVSLSPDTFSVTISTRGNRIPDGVYDATDPQTGVEIVVPVRARQVHGIVALLDDRAGATTEYPFVEGFLEGRAVTVSRDNETLAETTYIRGLRHGTRREFYPGGQLKAETVYSLDVLDGTARTFTPAGKPLEETPYREGKITGTYRSYYPETGTLSFEVVCVRDKQNGAYRAYSRNGMLEAEGTFENDRRSGPWTEYYDNRGVKSVARYVNGVRHGRQEEFYRNGRRKSVYAMTSGYIAGEVQEFHESGNLKAKYTMVDGSKEGPEYCYRDAPGQTAPFRIDTYRKGRLANRKTYTEDGKLEFSQDYP